jgi:hypothetical protein
VRQTREPGYEFHWDYNSFSKLFLFNYMITNIDNCEIKHQLNTEIFFLDHDNLIKEETKPIMKLNFQLTYYLGMKKN